MVKSSLPNGVKAKFTIDHIRLRSNSTTNKAIKLTKKCFFSIILGFTQSDSGELGDTESFFQKFP